MPRPPDRNARGDDTRAQLIEAGLALFGAQGYEAVATRALARAAGVNLAAIAYHFGGKEGLYQAVTQAVVDEVSADLLPAAEALRADLAAAGGDRAEIARLAAAFLRRLLVGFAGQERRQRHIAFVLREYAVPGPAFPTLFAGVVEPLHKTLTALAAAALGLPAENRRAIIAAHALVGQCLGFAIARAPLLRRLDWDRLSPERVEEVAATVVPLALAALGLPADAEATRRTHGQAG